VRFFRLVDNSIKQMLLNTKKKNRIFSLLNIFPRFSRLKKVLSLVTKNNQGRIKVCQTMNSDAPNVMKSFHCRFQLQIMKTERLLLVRSVKAMKRKGFFRNLQQ